MTLIEVEPGTIVRIGGRSLSTGGGIYDLSGFPPGKIKELAELDGVSIVEDRYPRVEKRDAPGWYDVLAAPGTAANDRALRRSEAEELLSTLTED